MKGQPILLPPDKETTVQSHAVAREMRRARIVFVSLILVASICAYWGASHLGTSAPSSHHLDHPIRGYCSSIPGITAEEFASRQSVLTRTLHGLRGGSYLAEPGASAGYYANLSGTQWHLSERPLLLHISPSDDSINSDPHLTILTPSFEATRAKLLPLAANKVSWVEWPEHEDPYATLLSSLPTHVRSKPIFIDGGVRHLIATGLSRAGADVQAAPAAVIAIRERKSPAEIKIMKCVNEATVLAIRHAQHKMHFGIRESQVREIVMTALSAAGLSNNWPLVLFGENAALPHGSGSDRALGERDFALIDCGGDLHGYGSDVTRTFALKNSKIPEDHLAIWKLVHSAQAAGFAKARNGTVAEEVDSVARKVIKDAGYGKHFTHRLGHGIGLETHESPYLVGGSKAVLAPGNSFSNEPGVYVEGKVGVRLEDCFYVGEDGASVYLTEGVGGPASSPWSP